MALSTSTEGSINGQVRTTNPQTAGQPASGGARSGSVQPGTATSVLTSQQGVALHATALPSITIGATPTQTSAVSNPPSPPAPKHHINPTLLGFPALLVIVAVVLFWTARRAEKITTE